MIILSEEQDYCLSFTPYATICLFVLLIGHNGQAVN